MKRRFFSSDNNFDFVKLEAYRDFVKPVLFTGFVCTASFVGAMVYQEERYRYIRNFFRSKFSLYIICN